MKHPALIHDLLLEDVLIAARTVFGEARGEPYDGKKAVAHVLLNRWKSDSGQFSKDDTLATACLRHVQFSAWSATDPNLAVMVAVDLNDKRFRECLRAMLEAFDEPDLTDGATHYHRSTLSVYWSRGHEPVAEIGNHVFFNDIP